MESLKHTKGEWFIQGKNLIRCNNEQVASANSMLDEYEANAKLIASAPELLEALIMLMHPNDMNDVNFANRAREKAKNLINKVTK